MAIARKVAPPPAPPPTYTLERSQDEAQFLADLIGNAVFGSSEKSRRMFGDAIYGALEHAGLRSRGSNDFEGEVRFL